GAPHNRRPRGSPPAEGPPPERGAGGEGGRRPRRPTAVQGLLFGAPSPAALPSRPPSPGASPRPSHPADAAAGKLQPPRSSSPPLPRRLQPLPRLPGAAAAALQRLASPAGGGARCKEARRWRGPARRCVSCSCSPCDRLCRPRRGSLAARGGQLLGSAGSSLRCPSSSREEPPPPPAPGISRQSRSGKLAHRPRRSPLGFKAAGEEEGARTGRSSAGRLPPSGHPPRGEEAMPPSFPKEQPARLAPAGLDPRKGGGAPSSQPRARQTTSAPRNEQVVLSFSATRYVQSVLNANPAPPSGLCVLTWNPEQTDDHHHPFPLFL
ncbi:basic proline-rich protein-like, partial [Crotalus tigris]|uniref:basic proline-rich protein-like n=1 Tax=Crotalus tigris TaxID=88082 RepID=UPI00192F58AE